VIWILVAVIVISTAVGDLLQTIQMKRHGEINDFDPRGLKRHVATVVRNRIFILLIVFMAISFFAFMKLITVAGLSFAVPATAASVVIETVLARIILKERVDRLRWAGTCLVAFGVALLVR
jgi:drug/metabolite transporter (DMT)-like permease